jgi:hypothetical protein
MMNVVMLCQYHPEIFEIYLRWSQSHHLTIVTQAETIVPGPIYSLLCQSYVLGEYLVNLDFKDVIIDAILQFSDTVDWILNEDVKYVYGNTEEDATLRRLLVRLTVERWCPETAATICGPENRKFHTVHFLCDVLACYRDFNWCKRVPPQQCEFHEHGGSECYKRKYRMG